MNKPQYWCTPETLMIELHIIYEFDYDPCPNPRPEGYNGLTAEWGQSNWVNPPFNSLMPWARKAAFESRKGKNICFAVPFYATNAIAYLCENGGHIQYLGRVRWHELTTGELQNQSPSMLTVMALVTFGYEQSDDQYFINNYLQRNLYTV